MIGKDGAPTGVGDGGAGRIRTGDPLLAKQVLCQLSYDPKIGRGKEIKRTVSQNLLCAINRDPDAYIKL